MAAQLARSAFLLLTLVSAIVARTTAITSAFWTVTANYEIDITTSTYTFDATSFDSITFPTTRTIKAGVTPTSPAVSTSTVYHSYSDMKVIEVYYPDDAVDDADLEPDTTTNLASSATTSTAFYMDITYTAPASCPSSFTFETSTLVIIPTELISLITPVSKTSNPAYTYTYASLTDPPSETWYLSAGAAPFTSSDDYYYTKYIENCEKPDTSSSNYDPDDDDDDITVCTWYSACTSLRTWIIVIAAILPSLFLLGFLESWFWFRRLMTGRSALRFGTICWIMMSLWVGCFTRTQSARSKDDQKLLRDQWNNMGSGTAFKLWWKFGFRHRYPEEVLGKYSRNNVGIVAQNGAHMFGTTAPPVQQMGPATSVPSPLYGNQGVGAGTSSPSSAPQHAQYHDASKDGSHVVESTTLPPAPK